MNRSLLTMLLAVMLSVYGCSAESAQSEAEAEAEEARATAEGSARTTERASDSEGGFFSNIFKGREEVAVPEGTLLKVALISGVSSESNDAGDVFEASMSESLVVDGKTAIPRGTRVRGRITDVEDSGRVEGRARIALELTEVLYDNDSVDIETHPFVAEAEGTKKRDAATIAGGSGIGAVIGAITGGGSGAAKGAAIGAGAGAGAVLLTKGKEVRFGPETRINFKLSDSVDLPVTPPTS